MEAQRLPQETVLQVFENVQELAWERIGKVVTWTVKHLVEALLEEELARNLGAGPYERTPSRQGHRGGIGSYLALRVPLYPSQPAFPRSTQVVVTRHDGKRAMFLR